MMAVVGDDCLTFMIDMLNELKEDKDFKNESFITFKVLQIDKVLEICEKVYGLSIVRHCLEYQDCIRKEIGENLYFLFMLSCNDRYGRKVESL